MIYLFILIRTGTNVSVEMIMVLMVRMLEHVQLTVVATKQKTVEHSGETQSTGLVDVSVNSVVNCISYLLE